MRAGGAIAPPLQQHQRAFNPEYRMREHTGSPRAIDLGNARERGCNPRRSEVHPIPRRAINNIPILDTIHLEINRQPIGKPGQIDFEIDNLRSLARLLACPCSFVLSFYSRLDSFLASVRQPWLALNPSKCHRIRDRGSLRQKIRLY